MYVFSQLCLIIVIWTGIAAWFLVFVYAMSQLVQHYTKQPRKRHVKPHRLTRADRQEVKQFRKLLDSN